MKTLITPHRILILFIVLNVSLCLLLSFVVYPSVAHKMDESYSQSFDEYNYLAHNILNGKGFISYHAEQTVIRGPGYPFFLAAVYFVAGPDNWAVVQILQSLFAGLTVFLSYILARRILKDEWKAVITAAVIAVHPMLVWYTFRISIESIFGLLCVSIFILMDMVIERPTYVKAIGLGLLIALAAYFKSLTLMFPILLFLILLLSKFKLLRALKYSGIVLIVTVLAIMPWTIRNYTITNKLVPVHATLASPILWGHYQVMTWADSPLSIMPELDIEYIDFTKQAEKLGFGTVHFPARSLKEEMLVEKAAMAYIKDIYLREPLTFFRNSALRFVMFWYMRFSAMSSLFLMVVSAFTLFFAAIGLKQLLNNQRIIMPLVIIITWLLIHSVLIGEARYQHSILPLMFIFTTSGIIHLYTRFFRKNNKAENHSSESLLEQS